MAAAGTRKFLEGHVIFREGESGNLAYVISSGKVEISKVVDGEKKVLATLGPDDVFGELALIDNAPRAATAKALVDTVCATIDKKMIQQKVQESDRMVQVLFKLMLNIIRKDK